MPDAVAGQTRSADRVRAEIDSLLPLYEEAAAEVEAAARRAEAVDRSIALDTVVVGPFRVVAMERQRELAERAFTVAWDRWAPRVAGAVDRLEGHVFVFDYGPQRPELGGSGPQRHRVHV
ncbi:MAG: hypothetical protein GWN71_23090, partial [Gammaproteobacteria bacterium]|nr:hypothetical protein [Gemmatimonadota bacterium]NIU76339.1 hypothetical protein [Gammaproteobacteria bacterium]